jgi:hypothetical protein
MMHGWGYGNMLGMIAAPPPAPAPKATTPLQKFLVNSGHDPSGAPDGGSKAQFDPVMGGSGMARKLGMLGGLLGPMGSAALGTAAGTVIDVGQTNSALATRGGYGVPYNSRGKVNFWPAFGNSMTWGMMGTSPLHQAIDASMMNDTGGTTRSDAGWQHADMGSMDYDQTGAPGAPGGGYADDIDYSDPGAYAQTDEGDWL